MIANLLDSLALPGAAGRGAGGKVGQAMMLYLATLRPATCSCRSKHRLPERRISTSLVTPTSRLVSVPARTRLGRKIAFKAARRTSSRLTTTRTGSLLTAAQHSDRHQPAPKSRRPGPSSTPAAPPGAQQGRDAHARNLLSNALVLKTTGAGSRATVLIHAHAIFHVQPVRGIHRALINGSKMICLFEVRPQAGDRQDGRGHRLMRRGHALRADAGRAPLTASGREHAAVHRRSRRC